jgi:undecaprenyl-diphosphatase
MLTTIDAISNAMVHVDMKVNALLFGLRDEVVIKTFKLITLLGEVQAIVAIAIIISIILWKSNKKQQIAVLWLTIIGSELTTFIAKIALHRQRPENAIFLENSYSFPSGHATIAIAFYGFIASLLLREITKKTSRALSVLVTVILITLIGFSRLYLGVHYLSDVLFGYSVGLVWLIIGIHLNNYARKNN